MAYSKISGLAVVESYLTKEVDDDCVRVSSVDVRNKHAGRGVTMHFHSIFCILNHGKP